MADEKEHSGSTVEDEPSLLEKMGDKIHGGDHHSSSSSSSDSDNEKSEKKTESVKAKVFRIFGRERPVHHVLGGGKPADVFLWRNKKVSAGVLSGATVIWVLFELLQYHLLTLVGHILIGALAILFLWSNAHAFIHKTPPRIPEVRLPEEPFLQVASELRVQINYAFALLHDIASGRDLKKFLAVIAGLWVLSVVGKWCNFLTLFYICFVLLHTVPVIYERYEDKIDPLAERATIEFKKQYAVFDAKVLSKIPHGLKNKRS